MAALVLLLVNDMDAGILLAEFLHQAKRLIGAAIIDRDDFPVIAILPLYRIETSLEILCAVVAGHHN